MKERDCYVDIWRDPDFGGESLRLYGPAEFPRLLFEQGDWGDQIGSLRVGPRAFVLAYRDRDFKDKKIAFGPNDEVADLRGLKFDDDIDSVQVIDSLKIFDRLLGRTGTAAGGEEKQGDRKRGKRGGKKKVEPSS